MNASSIRRIDTRKASRRHLHLGSIESAIAEADRIAAADRAETIRISGNWTAGQILNHLGAWAEYAYGGNPIKATWTIRLVSKIFGRVALRRVLSKGLTPGAHIPGVPGGTAAIERVPLDQGLDRFKSAFTRLEREAPGGRSPIFGAMSHEQWIALNLRHAELHMSFVAY